VRIFIMHRSTEKQIDMALEDSSEGKVYAFTGHAHVDKKLTSWAPYTDDYTNKQLPTKQGALFILQS